WSARPPGWTPPPARQRPPQRGPGSWRRRVAHRRGGHAAAADEQALHGLLVAPLGAGVADAHGGAGAVLHGLRDDPPAQGHLDGVLDVGHADAVARRPLAVDADLQVVLAADLPGEHPLRPLDLLQGPGDLAAHPVDGGQVAAEDLHADVVAHPGREHLDAVDDRLGGDVLPARYLKDALHLVAHQVAVRLALARPEADDALREGLLQVVLQLGEGPQARAVPPLAEVALGLDGVGGEPSRLRAARRPVQEV